jgi:hypothetical protein
VAFVAVVGTSEPRSSLSVLRSVSVLVVVQPENDQVRALAGLYEYWRAPAIPQDNDPAA